jgi:hypothetical protein
MLKVVRVVRDGGDVGETVSGAEMRPGKCSHQRKSLAYPLYEITLKKDLSCLLLSWKGRGTVLDHSCLTVSLLASGSAFSTI